MRKIAAMLLTTGLLAGCAGAEYKDNAAQVASDPRCMEKPNNPNEQPPEWCKRAAGVSWSSEGGQKLDFSGKSKGD